MQTTVTAKAAGSTFIQLTVTFPQAGTKLYCTFVGYVQDTASWQSTQMTEFSFRILKQTTDATAANAAMGTTSIINGIAGPNISTITVNSTTSTTAVIRVTLTGATTGTLIGVGELRVNQTEYVVQSGAWA
jgi:hypothetical protein